MDVSAYPNIQMTQTQVDEFSVWATEKYGNYRVYNEFIKSEEMTNYIRRHILSHEMKKILQETDIYVGFRSKDPYITRLQLYRQSIFIKMCFLKLKLGRQAFAQEVAEIKAQQDEKYLAQNEKYREQNERYYSQRALLRTQPSGLRVTVDGEVIPINQLSHRKTVTKQLTQDEVTKSMVEDCSICFIKHTMTTTCVIPCGHQFGMECFTKWKLNTCPLCRTKITETTVFIVPMVLTDIDAVALEVVALDVAAVLLA